MRTALVLACLLAAGVAGASLVPAGGAHGNHVSADPQVSADGTVAVESLFVLDGGHLVLHADDGGAPGEPVAHTYVEPGFHHGLELSVDDDAWASLPETATVHAVLHRDDGDERFEPADDRPIRTGASFARATFAVRKGDASASVLAARFRVQRTAGSRVVVPQVALPTEGYVALFLNDHNNTPSRAVGATRLGPGVHRNVTVDLNRSVYANQEASFVLWAVAYRADGDGEFDPDGDERIAVAGRPVATQFPVVKGEPGGATGTETDGSLVNTPEDSLVNTPETTAQSPTPDDPGSTPGFGALVAAVALAVVVLAAARRDS